ncbi:hypothetical protein [Tatumella ptyseos]|uniref:hypothetical protein n=1 Tax=Tatumella ptyseos TaxID=82987 RepID=UPI0026F21BB7|nr:hypothetical protein [Tatumella ptyseos]WKX27067.1 hypothetical protein QJR74_02665 [Tatumella ptyseos]
MKTSKIIIGLILISVAIIFYLYDKKNAVIFEKLDKNYYRRFRKYPNFYWLESFPQRYWPRIRPGVYGKLLQIKSYNNKERWLKTISEEEFNFIKKIPITTQKIIIKQMLFKLYLLYCSIIFIIVILLIDGGLDYLLEPVTHENIMQGISLL